MRNLEKDVLKSAGFAVVGETNLFYETTGRGFPLVLVHGGLGDSRMWDHQFMCFSQGFKVIRYDARGFGKSEVPDKPFFPYRDLCVLLKFLNIEKAHVLGLSMGGAVAIDFALEFPHMVQSLILAAPALHGHTYSEGFIFKGAELLALSRDEGAAAAVQALFTNPSFAYTIPPEESQHGRKKFKQMATDFFQVFRWDVNLGQTLQPSAANRISEIREPTLLTAGEKDHKENLAVVARLEDELGNAKKVLLPDTGHMVNMEKPEEFNRIVLSFLSENEKL